MPSRSRAALAAVCAAAAVLQCAAFQRLPLAPARRAALACGRGRCPARMARAPPQAAAGDDFEGEDEQAPRPKINWSDRFKRALDMNPGRTERLSRTEQELRYQQVLAANPKDVDALCGYACFLSTVKEDYVGASELYSTAVKTDPARARRITVQLWADLWAMHVENARVSKAKEEWRKLLEELDKQGRGRIALDDVRAFFDARGVKVPDEAIVQASRTTDQVYWIDLLDTLATIPPPSSSPFAAFFKR